MSGYRPLPAQGHKRQSSQTLNRAHQSPLAGKLEKWRQMTEWHRHVALADVLLAYFRICNGY